MTDNKIEPRPTPKLTVKNFSVIKEADLEFGKITVLIGPQASGKSLLCKLAFFLGRAVLEIAMDHVVRLTEFTEFKTAVKREFAKWFPQGGWGQQNWHVEFRANQYVIAVYRAESSELTAEPELTFSREFEDAYSTRLKESIEEQKKRGFLLTPALHSLAATRFLKVAGRGVWDSATYIPLERSFFVDVQKGYRVLAADAEPVSAKFAVTFADSLNRDIPKRRVNNFLRGDVLQLPDGPSISFPDGRLLPLNFLSSGSKEMLPIMSVLDLYEFRRRSSGAEWLGQELYGDKPYEFDELTIEEPEASLFPETQYELVHEIASLSNETDFHPHFTITTHSPYILSVFSDLVKAAAVGKGGSESHSAVAKVIPEKYWIDVGDFAAYKLENGNLVSIFDEKTGQIDGDYLDNVSGKISDELGQLLEIQYGS